MYADRYGRTGISPGALATAIGLNGAVIAALMFASPDIVTRIVDPPFVTTNIALPVDPPPVPEPKPDPKIEAKVRTPKPPPPEHPLATDPVTPDAGGYTSVGATGMDGGTVGGTGTVIEPPYVPPPHVPVVTGVQLDPRYAAAFQPAYPPSEMRAGHQGRVKVRVLVGIDGRVKQIEPVGTASEAFFEATRRQALSKWRFKPATRDGVPEEGWREMTVSFVLNGDD